MSNEKIFSYIFDEYAANMQQPAALKYLVSWPSLLSQSWIQLLLLRTTWKRDEERKPVFYIFNEYAANMQQHAGRSIFFSLATPLSSIQHQQVTKIWFKSVKRQ